MTLSTVVMRRFALFGGDCHYAAGGFHDYVGSYDTVVEAKNVATEWLSQHRQSYEWWHIFDTLERRIVECSEQQAYGAPNRSPKLDDTNSNKGGDE